MDTLVRLVFLYFYIYILDLAFGRLVEETFFLSRSKFEHSYLEPCSTFILNCSMLEKIQAENCS
jgi:hypothetical protein